MSFCERQTCVSLAVVVALFATGLHQPSLQLAVSVRVRGSKTWSLCLTLSPLQVWSVKQDRQSSGEVQDNRLGRLEVWACTHLTLTLRFVQGQVCPVQLQISRKLRLSEKIAQNLCPGSSRAEILKIVRNLSTSDFQSEVGEVFGEIGGELPAKFGTRFLSFFCWENCQKHFPPKLHRKFHHQTSLRGSGLWRGLEIVRESRYLRQTCAKWCSHNLHSACAPLCCKNMCCASRFCTGGQGAAGGKSKQMSKGP